MYRGFNIHIEGIEKDFKNNLHYYTIGSKLFKGHETQLRTSLRKLVLEDGTLDGATMQAQWFPQVEADIFISHSHADAEAARIIAGYLHEKLDLVCFVDSTVWGYGDELLRSMDNSYCRLKSGSYNYTQRNLSTAHVNLMLASAITQMINGTECLFFLNSSSSIKPEQVMDSTVSPWLYYEIVASQNANIRLPSEHEHRKRVISKAFSSGSDLITEALVVTHAMALGHLTEVTFTNEWLNKWTQDARGKTFALDALYELHTNDKII